MTRSEARLEIARSILRRQLNPTWDDRTCYRYMAVLGVPALVRYDDGTCEPTTEAGPVLLDRLLEGAAEVVHTSAPSPPNR